MWRFHSPPEKKKLFKNIRERTHVEYQRTDCEKTSWQHKNLGKKWGNIFGIKIRIRLSSSSPCCCCSWWWRWPIWCPRGGRAAGPGWPPTRDLLQKNKKINKNDIFLKNVIIFTGREHKVLPDHCAGLSAWLGGGVPAREKEKRVKKYNYWICYYLEHIQDTLNQLCRLR